MFKRSEGHFQGYKDTRLYFQSWETPNPVGHIILTHGQAEHSDCYDNLIQALDGLPWNVYAWDIRGHGRSDGKRGYAAHFNEYCEDYFCFYNKVRSITPSDKKLVLIAHSMGGLIQLKTQIDQVDFSADAQIFSSPLLGLSLEVSAIKSSAAQIANQLLPTITLSNEIDHKKLSRDPESVKKYDKDNLRHDRISPGVYLSMLEAIEYVQKRAPRIQIPSLFQIAGHDEIVNSFETKKFYDNIEYAEKKLIAYTDSYHEIYNDLDREQVYADLKSYLISVTEKK